MTIRGAPNRSNIDMLKIKKNIYFFYSCLHGLRFIPSVLNASVFRRLLNVHNPENLSVTIQNGEYN